MSNTYLLHPGKRSVGHTYYKYFFLMRIIPAPRNVEANHLATAPTML